MQLNGKQISHLRSLAHHLNPVVSIGNAGVSPSVVAETDQALAAHELIKLRLPAVDKKEKKSMLESLAEATGAYSVQLIGRVGVLYREGEKEQITL